MFSHKDKTYPEGFRGKKFNKGHNWLDNKEREMTKENEKDIGAFDNDAFSINFSNLNDEEINNSTLDSHTGLSYPSNLSWKTLKENTEIAA